ncbi:MAG: hypothetical protein K1X55_05940 [Chitinophagales bacterium]|nr:hypothetical protein [Chitinophagales bacterium]
MLKGRKRFLLLVILFYLSVEILPNLFYRNSGKSISIGKLNNGKLVNAYQVPFLMRNAAYFSFVSYFISDNGFVHSSVYKTIIDGYAICEHTCPHNYFRIMECSGEKGGKLRLHRTHQNGRSIDFMVPKLKNGKPFMALDHLGLWHYNLSFTDEGKWLKNSKVALDFETMAKHILALDDAGKKNGVSIERVILKIELKDDFYRTKSGKEVQRRGIYFAKSLPEGINSAHQDHYHIDFKIR